jgi:hypothetical protein
MALSIDGQRQDEDARDVRQLGTPDLVVTLPKPFVLPALSAEG